MQRHVPDFLFGEASRIACRVPKRFEPLSVKVGIRHDAHHALGQAQRGDGAAEPRADHDLVIVEVAHCTRIADSDDPSHVWIRPD